MIQVRTRVLTERAGLSIESSVYPQILEARVWFANIQISKLYLGPKRKQSKMKVPCINLVRFKYDFLKMGNNEPCPQCRMSVYLRGQSVNCYLNMLPKLLITQDQLLRPKQVPSSAHQPPHPLPPPPPPPPPPSIRYQDTSLFPLEIGNFVSLFSSVFQMRFCSSTSYNSVRSAG